MTRRRSSSKRVFFRRAFLNKPGMQTSAHVIAKVTRGTNRYGSNRPWWEYRLRLADCTRSIDLEFFLDDAEERRNSIHKIDLLVDTLVKFQHYVHLGAEEVEAHEASAGEDDDE